jgi:hypothetical protein
MAIGSVPQLEDASFPHAFFVSGEQNSQASLCLMFFTTGA